MRNAGVRNLLIKMMIRTAQCKLLLLQFCFPGVRRLIHRAHLSVVCLSVFLTLHHISCVRLFQQVMLVVLKTPAVENMPVLEVLCNNS